MSQSVQVGVILGSDSDLDQVKGALELLEKLDIGYELRILSAHRSPQMVDDYAGQACRRGLKVLIAAAGLSAALAGALAARCDLPVIGIPMACGSLNGLDALLSTVQMPPGVPVAAMAIGPGGARNAAILAGRILALNDQQLAKRMEQYRQNLEKGVRDKDQALQKNRPAGPA